MTDFLNIAQGRAAEHVKSGYEPFVASAQMCAQLSIAQDLRRIADALEKMVGDGECPAHRTRRRLWGRND